MPKRNEYIVIKRIHSAELFLNEVSGYNSIKDGFDWKEFEDTVRGYSNQGFICQGGLSICQIGNDIIVAQTMIYNKDNY